MKGDFLLHCNCFNMYTVLFPLPTEASDGCLEPKAPAHRCSPWGCGCFGDVQVLCEPHGAGTQTPPNNSGVPAPGGSLY